MYPSLQSLKRTGILSLRRAGIDRALGSSRWRRNRLLILAYHGISQDDEHEWNGALYMSPEMLEGRLRLLRSVGCSVLPLAEALQRLYDGTLEERSVAVTFDDGYVDFVTQAYPLLTAHGVPATVYLRTDVLGKGVPILRLMCSYMFWKARRPQVRIPELRSEPFDIGTREARARAVTAVNDLVRGQGLRAGDEGPILRAIAEHLSLDADAMLKRHLLEVMSKEDVQRLSAEGVDFQLHTHRHYCPRDLKRFTNEITTNRERIQALTGRPAQHFCYPSGDHDPLLFPWLTDLGVVSATTCNPGLASAATPPLTLPRFIDTSTTSPELFRSWLTGTAAWLTPRRTYGLRPA